MCIFKMLVEASSTPTILRLHSSLCSSLRPPAPGFRGQAQNDAYRHIERKPSMSEVEVEMSPPKVSLVKIDLCRSIR